jgi:hypothetical protein
MHKHTHIFYFYPQFKLLGWRKSLEPLPPVSHIKTTSRCSGMSGPNRLNGADVFPQITRYGSGFFAGVEYEDEVTLSPGLTVQQSIGVAVVAVRTHS